MFASELSCLEEALTVIAAMSCETIFEQDNRGRGEDVEQSRIRYHYIARIFRSVNLSVIC